MKPEAQRDEGDEASDETDPEWFQKLRKLLSEEDGG